MHLSSSFPVHSSVQSPSCTRLTHCRLFSWLHSLDVLSLLFLSVFIFIDISHPYCSSHPPSDHLASYFPLTPNIPHPSVCFNLTHVHAALLLRIPSRREGVLPKPGCTNFLLFLLLLLAGDVQLNPGPASIQFAHLNTCSASSVNVERDKPTLLKEFIADQDLEILALSETWLTPDTLPSTLNSLTPPNFTLIHNPRPVGRGGGVGFIYRSYLKVSRVNIPSFTSFESICIRLSISSSSFILLTIYRPPSTSLPTFIAEFSALLDFLSSVPSELIISGDFNIHVDNPSQTDPRFFPQ